MGIWNIHAALSFAFLLQQDIIHCKVVPESGQRVNAKTLDKFVQDSLQSPTYGLLHFYNS